MSTRISAEDYTHLLSADYWAFIQRINALVPDQFMNLAPREQRAAYTKMLYSLENKLPTHLRIQDHELPIANRTIPIRSYQVTEQMAAGHIIYFHGGGFVLGGLDSHHGICADLCASTGLALTAVDYRLAPEHLFPAGLEDAVLAYQALTAQTDLPLIVMGDSAGACLAAHIAHQLRGQAHAPIAQVLIYPVLGSDFSLESYERYALAPMLTTEEMQYYWRLCLGKAAIPKQLKGLPLADEDFRDLPPTVVFSAEFDPLVDEAALYCAHIKAAGGQAQWQLEKGLTHGYLHARQMQTAASASFRRIQQALKSLVT